jgi:hypothetical protein
MNWNRVTEQRAWQFSATKGEDGTWRVFQIQCRNSGSVSDTWSLFFSNEMKIRFSFFPERDWNSTDQVEWPLISIDKARLPYGIFLLPKILIRVYFYTKKPKFGIFSNQTSQFGYIFTPKILIRVNFHTKNIFCSPR